MMIIQKLNSLPDCYIYRVQYVYNFLFNLLYKKNSAIPLSKIPSVTVENNIKFVMNSKNICHSDNSLKMTAKSFTHYLY